MLLHSLGSCLRVLATSRAACLPPYPSGSLCFVGFLLFLSTAYPQAGLHSKLAATIGHSRQIRTAALPALFLLLLQDLPFSSPFFLVLSEASHFPALSTSWLLHVQMMMMMMETCLPAAAAGCHISMACHSSLSHCTGSAHARQAIAFAPLDSSLLHTSPLSVQPAPVRVLADPPCLPHAPSHSQGTPAGVSYANRQHQPSDLVGSLSITLRLFTQHSQHY